MDNKFFTELSRRLGKMGIKSTNREGKQLEVFLHSQPILLITPRNDVLLLPTEKNDPETDRFCFRIADIADEVFEYLETILQPKIRPKQLLWKKENRFSLHLVGLQIISLTLVLRRIWQNIIIPLHHWKDLAVSGQQRTVPRIPLAAILLQKTANIPKQLPV